ncbi:unnamed protein product [Tetraodon nigroviridis]|uniref:(spotted green pufferfish) hypothetical protein n=1 Tax=Tetraodon nigroviridis TaxID=99883 RepID=Q4SVW6_TETNG|nr:unnamed protein product [Tetraodon nigroviridis]
MLSQHTIAERRQFGTAASHTAAYKAALIVHAVQVSSISVCLSTITSVTQPLEDTLVADCAWRVRKCCLLPYGKKCLYTVSLEKNCALPSPFSSSITTVDDRGEF